MSDLHLYERLVDLMDHELAKALSHPLRVQLLEIFTREITSPSRIARKLNSDLSTISYHVNVLKDAGLLEGVRVKQVRGADEHFYRASRDASQLNCISAELDAKGCEEVSAVVDAAVGKVRVAQERSAKRLAKKNTAGVPATIIMASFESAIKSRGADAGQ